VCDELSSAAFTRKVDRDLDKAVIERKPQFPKEIFSKEAISLLTGLLQKRPENRLGCTEKGIEEIKDHPFFDCIDFGLLEAGYIVLNEFDQTLVPESHIQTRMSSKPPTFIASRHRHRNDRALELAIASSSSRTLTQNDAAGDREVAIAGRRVRSRA
jgi:hypothetical protein